MLSIEYDLAVPEFAPDIIGVATMVRAEYAEIVLRITNDGPTQLNKIRVKPVLELYIGQEKPQLFVQEDAQVIETLSPSQTISLTFGLVPSYPGLVAVAIHVTDINKKAVMVKRKTELTYKELPVRYWFHVADNISVLTLIAIKDLVERFSKGVGK
jgi:hypothetical protein